MEKNPEEGVSEDEDLQAEKARVKEALGCRSRLEVSSCLGSTRGATGGFHLCVEQDWGQTFFRAPVLET